MGVIKFLVPRREGVAADAAGRAYFAGIDEIPWQSRVTLNDDALLVERAEYDSGNLFFPFAAQGHGELMLSTGSLMERSAPYLLQVELARGTLNRVRNQLAAYEAQRLEPPEKLRATMATALEHFAWASTRKDQLEESTRRAEAAIAASLDAAWLLSQAYFTQMLNRRHQQVGKLGTLLGVNLGGATLTESVARELVAAFNTVQVPFNWRTIEPSEGARDWTLSDQQIEWARAAGMKVCGGPLLAVDKWSLPDWMYLWGEDDAESFRACTSEHIQEVVGRYRGKVQLWVCAARLNVENDFGHGEDERLRLAVTTIESIRRVDPRSPIVLSIDQPWGSFMGHQACDLSPLHFADALVRAELGLAGIGLEINFGYAPGGTDPRDPLELGRQLDRWSTLGLPLLVSLVVPSGQTADRQARRTDRVVEYAAGPISGLTQRTWFDDYFPVLLSKQPVQGLVWNQLLDSQPHAWAHGGLFDEQDQPKPLVEAIKAARREHLA